MKTEVRPMKSEDNANWPVSHTNAAAAAITKLLDAPANGQSHYITGYHMNGGGDADGFKIIRQRCVLLNSGTDTITIADNAALDWDTKANDGDFTLNLWAKFPETMGVLDNFILRGDEAADGWELEVTAGELMKFTAHDSSDTANVSSLSPVNDAAWHMWTVVVDRSSTTGMKIYRDGLLEASADPTDMALAMDGGTTVVMTGKASRSIYVGQLGLYIDKALSAAEIITLYNAPAGAVGNGRGVGRSLVDTEDNLIVGLNMDGNATIQVDIASGLVITEANLGVANDGLPREDDIGKVVGPFSNGTVSTNGGYAPHQMTFPHAIKIGNAKSLSIEETDGAFNLVLFGYTDSA